MNESEKEALLKAIVDSQQTMQNSLNSLNNKFDNLIVGKNGGGVLSRMSVQEERTGGVRWACGVLTAWLGGLTVVVTSHLFHRQQ